MLRGVNRFDLFNELLLIKLATLLNLTLGGTLSVTGMESPIRVRILSKKFHLVIIPLEKKIINIFNPFPAMKIMNTLDFFI